MRRVGAFEVVWRFKSPQIEREGAGGSKTSGVMAERGAGSASSSREWCHVLLKRQSTVAGSSSLRIAEVERRERQMTADSTLGATRLATRCSERGRP